MKTISFIGAGNMGSAVAKSVCRAVDPAEVVVYDRKAEQTQRVAAELNCAAARSMEEAVRASGIIMLCVKPQSFAGLAEQLIPLVKACAQNGEEKVIASIMAGISLRALEDKFAAAGLQLPVIRIMPNTPALVGQGVFLLTGNEAAQKGGTVEQMKTLLAMGGLVEETDERMMDLATPLYSCSPAWVAMFIEALADGGVAIGVPREKALRLAAQGVMGTAALLLESGRHPGAVKDTVCSPGGITIQGVLKLEELGMRSAVIQAVLACEEKRREMTE